MLYALKEWKLMETFVGKCTNEESPFIRYKKVLYEDMLQLKRVNMKALKGQTQLQRMKTDVCMFIFFQCI